MVLNLGSFDAQGFSESVSEVWWSSSFRYNHTSRPMLYTKTRKNRRLCCKIHIRLAFTNLKLDNLEIVSKTYSVTKQWKLSDNASLFHMLQLFGTVLIFIFEGDFEGVPVAQTGRQLHNIIGRRTVRFIFNCKWFNECIYDGCGVGFGAI